jgi:hypothetical protein
MKLLDHATKLQEARDIMYALTQPSPRPRPRDAMLGRVLHLIESALEDCFTKPTDTAVLQDVPIDHADEQVGELIPYCLDCGQRLDAHRDDGSCPR